MANNMNSAADRDRRQRNGHTRGRDLYWGFSLGILSNLVTLFLLSTGAALGLMAWALTATIVGTFVFVIINSFNCMDDLKENANDMDEVEANTHLGQKFLSTPWGLFKSVILVVFGAIAIAQLDVVWGIF